MNFTEALNKVDYAVPDHGNEEVGTALEKLRSGAELLDWLMTCDNLLWKTWHYMGGRQKTEVYLNDPVPHELQAEGPSVLEALTLAKLNNE